MANDSQASALVSALGTLIGYLGAESAVEDVYDRLLWPQRYFNAVTWRDALQVGLLAPMGGPIHKAALTTVDKFYHNGLFKGRDLGNMLGTAFFQDTGLKYKEHEPHSGRLKEEYIRNGIWVQAVSRIPYTAKWKKSEQQGESGEEKPLLVRANSSVNILQLSYVQKNDTVDPAKLVTNDVGPITLRTILAIIWSESTSLITGGTVFIYWRSAFALLWFLPLILKLLSAAFALDREGILPPPQGSQSAQQQQVKCFEVDMQSNGFLIIEGAEYALMQFLQHYGHPIRNRLKETIQITIVVALGLIFPAGLVCSLIWMPVGMQYFWLGYQLYTTTALYVARYTKGYQWHTTDARLAQKFAQGEMQGESVAYLRCAEGRTVVGRLTRIPIRRYREGQEVVSNYLATRASVSKAEEKGTQ
ncbi:MAG: hypothetical protein Q9163_002654 [Psora crenata]